MCVRIYIYVLADGNFNYKMAKNKIAIAKILYMNQRNETCSPTYEKEKQHTEKVAFYDHHNKFYLCELARVCFVCTMRRKHVKVREISPGSEYIGKSWLEYYAVIQHH